jgi:hypothetical protein
MYWFSFKTKIAATVIGKVFEIEIIEWRQVFKLLIYSISKPRLPLLSLVEYSRLK